MSIKYKLILTNFSLCAKIIRQYKFMEKTMSEFLHIILHSFTDSIKLLPFLFLTYLLMEYLEHRSGDIAEKVLKRSGQFGSLIGSSLGLLPQCGFSSAAAGLFAAKVISLGTMLAVFLATSDEMIPILISHNMSLGIIVKILLVKFVIALIAGISVDLIVKALYKKHSIKPESKIEEFCEREDCHCHNSIFKPALIHTLKIGAFIFVFTLALNSLVHFVGEDNIALLILNKPFLANILSALVGLIPNCASSIIISELYVDGILSAGVMLSGLLANSGVALAVLFRTNRPKKNNFIIVAILLVISIASGLIIDLLPIF